jgi:hypothetical protein
MSDVECGIYLWLSESQALFDPAARLAAVIYGRREINEIKINNRKQAIEASHGNAAPRHQLLNFLSRNEAVAGEMKLVCCVAGASEESTAQARKIIL